jgi:hypothetical protein
MFFVLFSCRVGSVEGVVVDKSRNDRVRGEKEKMCGFLTQRM